MKMTTQMNNASALHLQHPLSAALPASPRYATAAAKALRTQQIMAAAVNAVQTSQPQALTADKRRFCPIGKAELLAPAPSASLQSFMARNSTGCIAASNLLASQHATRMDIVRNIG